MLTTVFEQFVKASPITVMARALIEWARSPDFLDDWFTTVADKHYTRTLLFSTLCHLMRLVVCGIHKTVGSAYQALEADIGVTGAGRL